jgi:hypothetical protein
MVPFATVSLVNGALSWIIPHKVSIELKLLLTIFRHIVGWITESTKHLCNHVLLFSKMQMRQRFTCTEMLMRYGLATTQPLFSAIINRMVRFLGLLAFK